MASPFRKKISSAKVTLKITVANREDWLAVGNTGENYAHLGTLTSF
jgi:hypothetical protein